MFSTIMFRKELRPNVTATWISLQTHCILFNSSENTNQRSSSCLHMRFFIFTHQHVPWNNCVMKAIFHREFRQKISSPTSGCAMRPRKGSPVLPGSRDAETTGMMTVWTIKNLSQKYSENSTWYEMVIQLFNTKVYLLDCKIVVLATWHAMDG